jgi:hypothetical protein
METVTWSSSSGNLFGGWCSWRWQASEHVLNYSASHIGLVYLSHGLSLLRVNLVLLNKCSLESSSKRKLDSCMLSKKKEMASNWEISLNCRIQPTTFSHSSKTLPKFLLNFFNGLNYHLRSGLWTAVSYTRSPNVTKTCTSKSILVIDTPSIGGLSSMLDKSLGAWFFWNAGPPSLDASRSTFSFLETVGHYLPPKTWKTLNTP